MHYSQLVGAVRKFKESQDAIKYMSEMPKGFECMIPLTSSLYVPGRMDDNQNVLLEAGAGYFVEKNI
jgi:prefoldin alpha subunit